MDLCNMSLFVEDANSKEEITSIVEGNELRFSVYDYDDDNSCLQIECNSTEATETVLDALKDYKWMAFAEAWQRIGSLESGIYLIASEKMSNKIDRQIYVSSMDFHNEDRYSFYYYPVDTFEDGWTVYGSFECVPQRCQKR